MRPLKAFLHAARRASAAVSRDQCAFRGIHQILYCCHLLRPTVWDEFEIDLVFSELIQITTKLL